MADSATDLVRTGPEMPRYIQIFQALRERIETGAYPVGGFMPTEAELCGEFEVSRYTVREAMRRLTDQGFVTRRQGSGTIVQAADARSAFTQSMRSLSELFQYALDTHYDITRMAMIRLDEATAAIVEAPPGSRWLQVDGLRRTRDDQLPICHTTVYVNQRFAGLKDEFRGCRGPIYGLIEQRSGEPVAEAVQTISGELMPEPVRAALGSPEGGFALRISRRYLDRDGGTMLISINHHPSEHYAYTMRMRRDVLD